MPGPGSRAMPKPRPSLLTKRDAKRQEQAEERRVRAAVKIRDGGMCRVCRELCGPMETMKAQRQWKAGSEMHHIVPRSLGGATDTRNCIWCCKDHHAERHAGVIRISGNGDGEIQVERIWR